MELSVIIPVYNGEKTIKELFRRLKSELENISPYEIIFVHDCGKDSSWPVIEKIVRNNSDNIKGYKLARNYGQHNAILYGISKATGDFIVTLDEDLQHDPSIIRKLTLEQKKGNYDVVYAKFKKLRHPGMRISTSELLRQILKRIVPGLFPGYSPFRLIRGDVAQKMLILKNSYTFIDGYLGILTKNIGYINVDHYRRADGVSSYSYYKLFRHAVMIAIAHSPLKRWILTTALLFNSGSIILFFSSEYIKDISFARVAVPAIGISGLLLLLSGLIAEAIHFRGMKSNLLPVAKIEK